MQPIDGAEPHVAQTRRGNRPQDEGYEESAYTVTRLQRPIRDGERLIDGKPKACPAAAAERALARMTHSERIDHILALVDQRITASKD